MWKINQKVVCVYTPAAGGYGFESLPQKGEIYTIREIIDWGFDLGIGLRLEEIVNKPMQYGPNFGECTFHEQVFRPVDETFGEEVAEKLEKEFISQPEPALV